MLDQDEETVELRETFTSLQQEVEAKTKKLKKVNGARNPKMAIPVYTLTPDLDPNDPPQTFSFSSTPSFSILTLPLLIFSFSFSSAY